MNLERFFNKNSAKTPEDIQKELEKEKQKQIEYYKNVIKNEPYLWDMRCWDKYKDKEEVKRWLENGCEPNNCGHAVFCINKLLENGTSKEEIIELILQNPHIQFKNRLVKCFANPDLCPILKENDGDYSKCNCIERCG